MKKRVDYIIEIEMGNQPGEHEVVATIKATRYNDGITVGAKTIKAAMRKAADWIEEH